MKTFVAIAALLGSASAFQAGLGATKLSPQSQVTMLDGPKAGMAAGLAALTLASGANALTKEQVNSMSYDQIKGTGLANRCQSLPTDDNTGSIKLASGKSYRLYDLCIEPKTFAVLEESTNKKTGATSSAFVDSKLMTRETYSLYGVEGKLTTDGTSFKFSEKEGIDYAPTTVQKPGGERVPFLFTVKQLAATGKGSTLAAGTTFGGKFNVPSYRSGAFLDPKGRGMYTGYDQAQGLMGLTASDDMLLFAENNKKFDTLKGEIEFKVTGASNDGDIEGVFVSQQPGDTDMGGKAPEELLIKGIFYASVE